MIRVSSIPQFPSFKRLTFSDKKRIETITSSYPAYSDYNFASLWSYNTQNDFLVSMLHKNLVIRFRDYITKDTFYSFLGTHNIQETIETLFAYLKKKNLKPELKLIPEVTIETLKETKHDFLITEDRDNFDYVYNLSHLSDLNGRFYSKKRNKVKKFLKEHSHMSIQDIHLNDNTTHKHILSVFSKWEEKQGRSSHEKIAIQRLLKKAHFFDLLCLGLYSKTDLKAFSIVEIVQNGFVMVHFSKADRSYTGIFETLYKTLADTLREKGSQFLNREQDMGLSRLRHAKQSWGPLYFLKKYTVSQA